MSGSIWEKEGESGLLDNFEFTVTNAFFAPHEKYMNGEVTLLNWEGTTDSLDVPLMHVWYSLGGGWESKDGGLTIVHDSGNADKYFNKSSQIYKIISRCRDDFKITAILEKRGDPFHAATWNSLKFRMQNETQPGIRGAEGKDKTMPVEYLGEVGSAGTNGSSAPQAAASGAGVETPQAKMARLKAEKAAAANGADTTPATLRDQVVAILTANDDFDTAQAACLELDGIMDDDDLVQGLMDADGLFAEVKASV